MAKKKNKAQKNGQTKTTPSAIDKELVSTKVTIAFYLWELKTCKLLDVGIDELEAVVGELLLKDKDLEEFELTREFLGNGK